MTIQVLSMTSFWTLSSVLVSTCEEEARSKAESIRFRCASWLYNFIHLSEHVRLIVHDHVRVAVGVLPKGGAIRLVPLECLTFLGATGVVAVTM